MFLKKFVALFFIATVSSLSYATFQCKLIIEEGAEEFVEIVIDLGENQESTSARLLIEDPDIDPEENFDLPVLALEKSGDKTLVGIGFFMGTLTFELPTNPSNNSEEFKVKVYGEFEGSSSTSFANCTER